MKKKMKLIVIVGGAAIGLFVIGFILYFILVGFFEYEEDITGSDMGIVTDDEAYSDQSGTTTTEPGSDTQRETDTISPQAPEETTEPGGPAEPSNLDEPGIPAEPDDLTEPGNTSAEPAAIIVNDVDLKAEVKAKVIDNILYAEGASFVEALRWPDCPEGMHEFNYQYGTNSDELSLWLSEYDYDRGLYIREELELLLHKDAIIITSYATDAAMYILFIDSTEVVQFVDDEGVPALTFMDEAPCIVDGEVYIPMQAFTDLTGYEIVIE